MNRSRLSVVFVFLLLIMSALFVQSEPQGFDLLANITESPDVPSAQSLTTVGGSFTTMSINTTQQTPRWKAYVGNVSGQFVLNDANNASIYDWQTTNIIGEVYASRVNTPDWSQIRCANMAEVVSEQTFHNMTSTQVDRINNTFNDTVHAGFFVGSTQISASTCYAIATYVNEQRQNPSETADFQEIILTDTSDIVWATILEENSVGYNNGQFDFQMIVPESEVKASPTTYYFFVEIS